MSSHERGRRPAQPQANYPKEMICVQNDISIASAWFNHELEVAAELAKSWRTAHSLPSRWSSSKHALNLLIMLLRFGSCGSPVLIDAQGRD
jgi:hypothetical protein